MPESWWPADRLAAMTRAAHDMRHADVCWLCAACTQHASTAPTDIVSYPTGTNNPSNWSSGTPPLVATGQEMLSLAESLSVLVCERGWVGSLPCARCRRVWQCRRLPMYW